MFKRRIYLDYASLTPIDRRVMREVAVFSADEYANPSSLHKEGVAAKNALIDMRKKTAGLIHALPDEIIFTAGGTEANSIALQGVAMSARKNGIARPRIVISEIEHSSIIETAAQLESYGCEVVKVPVDSRGIVVLDELKKAITPSTVIVSIMSVNNEVGSIQPIKEIAHLVRKVRAGNKEMATSMYPLFHTDAAQAFLYQELFVERLGVDLMTLDGSKVYGPRGVGCLYIKRGTPIVPLIHGGGQEKGMRSGTENLPGIAGFVRALEIGYAERPKESMRIAELKDRFISGVRVIRSDIAINGDPATSSPHIVSISIPAIDNEFFLFQLDAKGIACSTKSSCLRDEEESYVLKAMGVDSKTSLRFSFGRNTRKSGIEKVLKIIKEILAA